MWPHTRLRRGRQVVAACPTGTRLRPLLAQTTRPGPRRSTLCEITLVRAIYDIATGSIGLLGESICFVTTKLSRKIGCSV